MIKILLVCNVEEVVKWVFYKKVCKYLLNLVIMQKQQTHFSAFASINHGGDQDGY